MTLHRRLLPLLCLPLALTSHALGKPAESYRMSGTCQLGDGWLVSLVNTKSGDRFWIRDGQRLGALKFNSFDAETHTAAFSHQAVDFELRLSRPEAHDLPVVQSMPLGRVERDHIAQKVSEYKEGLKLILAEPSTGPRTPSAQAKLEKDVANMVTNYRNSLIAELSQEENEVLSSSDGPRRGIIGVKRRNRVNSRIWASDHIEKHGMPSQP